MDNNFSPLINLPFILLDFIKAIVFDVHSYHDASRALWRINHSAQRPKCQFGEWGRKKQVASISFISLLVRCMILVNLLFFRVLLHNFNAVYIPKVNLCCVNVRFPNQSVTQNKLSAASLNDNFIIITFSAGLIVINRPKFSQYFRLNNAD
jgi:hypothetical protein